MESSNLSAASSPSSLPLSSSSLSPSPMVALVIVVSADTGDRVTRRARGERDLLREPDVGGEGPWSPKL